MRNTVLTNVLVANRGEIARRVFRSCARLGLSTVAVYSDPDAGSAHVTEADAAVRLPGSTAAETYLRGDLVIEAALRAGADAVHPGYGFLSENAGFAGAVLAAGLAWIGPSPEAIAAMGSKIESKRLMAGAGVPVLSALDPDQIGPADLPVLIKASAGGGGRGMRIVRTLDGLPGALEAAASEARSAFGDPAVFCEPYVEPGRHIEVQVLADTSGTIWTVGERECSIQRRHQKIIEETPSPLADRTPGMRDRLQAAARLAAATIGYVGAGTVEFLADEAGRFWFLEMNTRLQVEHPVTEAVTGLDLVAWQLRIAAGRSLPPSPPTASGHAIEARLYAEDPAAGWQPQSGTLRAFAVPGVKSEFIAPAPEPGGLPAVRLDSGVVVGSQVGVFYDPMLAKVIAWAPDREAAAAALARSLATATIHGLTTNRDLLVRVLRHPAFLAGQTDSAFFDTHGLDGLSAPLADDEAVALSAVAAALAESARQQQDARVLGGLPPGWRNVPSQLQRTQFAGHDVSYGIGRSGLVVAGRDDLRLISMAPGRVELEAGGVRRAFDVAAYDGLVCVDSALGPVTLVPQARFADPAARLTAGSLLAPMPGTVVRIGAAVGDRVAAGQPLLWLEAMKMEHVIAAPVAGIVTELPATAGQQIEVGTVLAVVKAEEDQ
jgi:propionyl-CoA carboxylase alpha chain